MSRWIQISLRTLGIALALVALGWILGVLLPAEKPLEEPMGRVTAFFLSLVSAWALTAPLYYPIHRSRLTGRSLFGAAFLAVFGLSTFLTQVESALFLDVTAAELAIEVLKMTLTSLLLAGLATALFSEIDLRVSSESPRANPPSTGSWIRRWIGVSFLYLVLYMTAGLLILPLIKTWYEAQGTLEPNFALFVPMQIARGALFVAFVLPLLRSMQVKRWQASLSMAVMIPLVHGVASLIPPNPYMPDYVRHAHMIEIGWSNFVLGLLIGYLFWNPPGVKTE